MRKAALTLTLLSASAFTLGACSGKAASTLTSSAPMRTAAAVPPSLPAALDNAEGLQTMAEALKVTGAARTFEGKGSFTLLAPEDDAFAAAGDPDSKLMVPGDHAALTTLVMDHTLPGHVTRQDLGDAIDASPTGQITISSLGGEDLTFTRSGKTITVTAPDGSQAVLDGDPVLGGSSIAIPISNVLQKPQADSVSS